MSVHITRMKGFLQEFRAFAMRGNVIDMAIGVVIGTAFGKITSSLVADVIMPPLGILIGKVNFKDLKVTLLESEGKTAVTLNYGSFLQEIINFSIIAFVLFLLIKLISKLQKKQDAADAKAAPPRQEMLLEEIRDILKKKS
jgi:large conductance mechanosensitive channel